MQNGTSTWRYLYRGVIRENDIVACSDGQVTFRYRDAKSGTMMLRTVPGAQFLWLVLQHVLPKGGLQTGAQLWVSASELQAANRFAASGAEVRSGAGAGGAHLGQAACAVSVLLLRGADDDCADADSIFACGARDCADSYSARHRSCWLIR